MNVFTKGHMNAKNLVYPSFLEQAMSFMTVRMHVL